MAGKKRSSSGGTVLVILVLAVIAAALMFTRAGKLNGISIEGASNEEKVRLMQLCGLEKGMSLEYVNESDITRAIKQEGRYELLEYDMRTGNDLHIRLRERQERAQVRYAGNLYVIDEYSQVIKEYSEDAQYNLLEVTGLEMRSASVGSELVTEDKNQILAVNAVIRALDSTGLYSMVTELNAGDLDNMYLMTIYGYRIEIGDMSDADGKCELVLGVIQDLIANGTYGGTIEATNADQAVYKPN